ncbi:MAG: hypothetical protein NW241_04275 [Bacteroidia bacterium]|nr:hypothetical protein [Bacteroidia bacterium]
MAKRFLDILSDAFDDEVLSEVIPRSKPAAPAESKPAPSRRKKRFVEAMNEHLPVPPQPQRKTLLDAMQEALDGHLFDEIVTPGSQRSRKPAPDQFEAPALESPFSTMITTEVLERARQIAMVKGLRVKDVINVALRYYVDQEWKQIQPS